MTPRYLIFASDWNLDLGAMARIAEPTGFEQLFAGSHCVIFCEPGGASLRLGPHGAILGRLFDRFGPPRSILNLDPAEASALAADGGARLLSRYWGEYVAVLATGHTSMIIRDPSGAVPCCMTDATGLTIFASDAAVLRRAERIRPSISWRGIGRHLFTNGLPSIETGLDQVSELLPGFSMKVGAGERSTFPNWSPWDHVAATSSDEAEGLFPGLRRTIENVVSAQASSYRRILAGVSGGLDSSIVAACLGRTRTMVHCVTLATEESDGDERRFARCLAGALDLPLIEEWYSAEDIVLDRAAAPQMLRPTSRAISLAYDSAVAPLIADLDATAFFTGNGGDNVFAYSLSATSILDRMRDEGLRPTVLKTVRDVCRLTHCSPWRALWKAFRRSRLGNRYDWKSQPLFLHPDFIAVERELPCSHPWLDAPPDGAPGKAVHVALLLRLQAHLHASEWALQAEVVTPLMTQPVMEACLRIPSWRWCEGGIDRAPARNAFAVMLPHEILQRRSKGGPNAFAAAFIDRNRADIRSRLLDGNLAKHGIVDRFALDAALNAEAPCWSMEVVQLLALLEAEAWIDYWSGPLPEDDRAAASLARRASSASQPSSSD